MPQANRRIAVPLIVAALLLPGSHPPPARAVDPPGAASAAAPVAPVLAGMARVWFLRQFEPSEGLRTPMIYVNGAPLAASVSGTVFYRDFAAGTYTFSVETCTQDFNQTSTLNLAPGSETDLEVQSLSSFHSWGCLPQTTFYIRPIPARWAAMYWPQLVYLGPR